MTNPRIYFDNAATSWPKPESVYKAVERAMRDLGAPAGRGHYRQAVEVNFRLGSTRDRIAELIHANSARNIVFCYSCTDALNTALLGLLRNGDHVVTSVVEHNSVLRPLAYLQANQSVNVTHVDCDCDGVIDRSAVIAAIQANTRLVVLSHASNVTGAIQELAPIGKFCREKEIPFLVDAAQSIGHLPIDVREIGCDLLAAAGHKGLLAPLGTGFLYVADSVADRLQPLRFGGTGSSQLTEVLPSVSPEKFEAGNLNVPGILGMEAGLDFLRSEEGLAKQAHLKMKGEHFSTALQQLPSVVLHGPRIASDRLPVFAIQLGQWQSHDLAAILDSQWGIQTRSGYHCAPKLHQLLGTERTGGLLRISLGLFNDEAEIDVLLNALNSIV